MADDPSPRPAWRDTPPAPGTYREILMFDPQGRRHPSDGWVRMFKEEFAISDEDFVPGQATGDDPVVVDTPPMLDPRHRAAMVEIVGPANVADDDLSRVRYGHGKSIDEDVALRAGSTPRLPDLVVHPRNKADVAKIVAYCHRHRIPIVPFGAGSTVVIGTEATRGGVVLVLRTHMNQLLAVDEADQTATVQPGMLGPDYEAALNTAPARFGTSRAYTGGHFPQSFQLASVGGWVTALGSGQASTYYGDAYDLVVAQEYVTAVGTIVTQRYAATANGPKVNDILKGSEGTLGVLVELTLKIYRHQPQNTTRFALMMPSWQAAVDAAREIVQGEFGLPAVLRISDPEETERGLALKGFDRGLANRYFTLRGLEPMQRCLLLGTAEGEKGFARHVAAMAKKVARSYAGVNLSGHATRQWEHGRYDDIHLRNDIMDFGMVIDTFETSVTWSNLMTVYERVRALVKSRPGTICMTHASHFYGPGTNLYFILILKPDDFAEYVEFRARIIDEIIASGGSPSHHHGTGRLFSPWLESHLGPEQMGVLRAIKAHLDPHGIMNPGGTLGLDSDPS